MFTPTGAGSLRRHNRATWIALALMGLGTLTLPACGGGDGGSTGPDPTDDEEPRLTFVSVSPARAILSSSGASQAFTATATDQNGREMSGVDFDWSVSDASVATVDGEGVVTARSDGATVVEAEASGVTDTARLAVRAERPEWDFFQADRGNSCGVATHATLYCWGDNDHGNLGTGDLIRAESPLLIDTDLFFVHVAGSGHMCALGVDGMAYCWGDSRTGERGTGVFDDDYQETPVAVSTTRRFTQLTTGGGHTCGLATDGTALCWGNNDHGQVGDGTTSRRATPTEVDTDLSFTHIHGASNFTGSHTCAVATDGRGYCWGLNRSGQLGDGSTKDRHAPVAVEGDLNLQRIGAGMNHSCGLTIDGTVLCWGANGGGQLGDGSRQDSGTPVAVSGNHTFAQLTVGADHACGLTDAGTAYCWGLNTHGQLGDGTNESRTTPVEVAGGHTFGRLDAGAIHTCGLTTDATLYCWGDNQNGQVGDGTDQDRSEPTRVSDPGS